MKKFIHLHCHSEYSLLDGAIRIESLVKKASSLSMPALALTDHGNLFGAIKFYKSAINHGIKPIIGCELYVCESIKEKKQNQSLSHLTVLAKDTNGYKNLIKLVSISYVSGFYYKPRVDETLLKEYSKGLIALSGCTKGLIPRLILEGRIDEAEKKAIEYLKLFDGNFFLEVLKINLPSDEIIMNGLFEIGKRLGIPLVATNDIHYLEKDDYTAHDVLICIQTGKKIGEEKRLKFQTPELYFKTEEEMRKLFLDFPSLIENTLMIADACNLELEFGGFYLPHYETGKETPDEVLRRLCISGLKERYQDNETARERLEYELSVIAKMRYAGYFLIIHDLIQYAKKEGIPVGPGRGSVAGSIVAYCLSITDIDPLKYHLLFERFLNPNRVSLPDIDIDFCYKRRDEILSYVTKKYGSDKTAQIITFGTMLARQVLRDTGRVLGFDYSECDKLAKMLNEEPNITLREALVKISAFSKEYRGDEKKRYLIDIAIKLEGLTRHASTHAAGIVISPQPLTDLVPLYKDPSSGRIATQYSKDDIEAIGLLKMDFLGLTNLTVIHDTIKLIKERRGIEIDIKKIPMDDKKTYELLEEGTSIGLFQLESPGMQDLLKRIKPTNFEELIAILALHRPGPLKSGMIDDFIERKQQRKKIEYPTPLLKPILQETYGVIVYQEQVMQIAGALAGFSMSAADELRRAMSKKNEDRMRKLRDEFIRGCMKHGHSEHLSLKIFELIAKFAEYGFNKSHSAAYALIAYQTAFLKANYPLFFMCSLITNELNNQDKVALYIQECKRMGIKILPPDINASYPFFTIEGDDIRFSLTGIKHVGELAASVIVKERMNKPFSSLSDFCNRVDTRLVNKRVIESLIKVGAFDSLGKRSCFIVALDDILSKVGGKKSKQGLLFEEEETSLPDIPEWDKMQKLKLEKELTGVYLSGHPLEGYKNRLLQYKEISSLSNCEDGIPISIAGMIKKARKTKTKNGETMAFIEIEDLTGSIEVILFPEAYKREGGRLFKDEVIVVNGKLSQKREPKVIGEKVLSLGERGVSLHIRLNPEVDEDILYKIKDKLYRASGDCPFYLHFGENGKERVFLGEKRIGLEEGLIMELKKLVGKEGVWVE